MNVRQDDLYVETIEVEVDEPLGNHPDGVRQVKHSTSIHACEFDARPVHYEEESMTRVTSRDGTTIAYDHQGSGPAVILVGGGLVDPVTGRAGRWENAPLATELGEHFSVYNYDRRGRTESGDTLPYAVEREIEDIETLIAVAGGSAHLYGVSSGGALAMEAAAAGIAVNRLAVTRSRISA